MTDDIATIIIVERARLLTGGSGALLRAQRVFQSCASRENSISFRPPVRRFSIIVIHTQPNGTSANNSGSWSARATLTALVCTSEIVPAHAANGDLHIVVQNLFRRRGDRHHCPTRT